jgi:uncharacterized Zn finger protein (UPF0148 family)
MDNMCLKCGNKIIGRKKGAIFCSITCNDKYKYVKNKVYLSKEERSKINKENSSHQTEEGKRRIGEATKKWFSKNKLIYKIKI